MEALAGILMIGLAGGFLLLGLMVVQVNKSILKLKNAKEQTQKVVFREMNSDITYARSKQVVDRRHFDEFGERVLEDLKHQFAKELVDNLVEVEVVPTENDYNPMTPTLTVNMKMKIVKPKK